MSTYKLTYFDSRGLVEPCRLIFAYAGVKYEDIRIPISPSFPLLTADERKELVLPWGQVPTLEVDGKLLCQSRAILLFVAKKCNLLGSNEWEEAKCNEVVDAVMTDFVPKWVPLGSLLKPDKETEKKELLKKLVEEEAPPFLERLNQSIKDNGTGFCVGSSLTVSDILVMHWMTHLKRAYDVELLKPYPEVEKLVETVCGLPGIKEWIAKSLIPQY